MFRKQFKNLFLENKNKKFIFDTINKKKTSFNEFFNNSIKISNYLFEKENLRRGDKIILKIEHSALFYEIIIACAIIGVIACPVFQSINSFKLKKIKELIKSKLVITSKNQIYYSTNSELTKNFYKFNYNQEFLIIFSSGTTSGDPKGIVHSLGNVIDSAKSFSKLANFKKNDVFFAFWPQHYMAGIFNLFFVPLVLGSTIVFCHEFKTFLLKDILLSTKRFGITQLYLSPTMCSAVINFKSDLLKNFKFTRKINVISTSNILYPSIFKNFLKFFNKKIKNCYGLTELGGSLTINLSSSDKADFCVGKFSDDIKVKCKGTKSRPSEIFIKSKYIMNRCINYNFKKDDYYKTGDIGYLYKQKLFILGRIGDNIKKGGEFVSVTEIENLILSINGIKNSMAVPVKDEFYGFRIKLFVEMEAGFKEIDIMNKINSIFDRLLTKNEVPDDIIFKKNIKKTTTGKNIKYLYSN